MSWVDHEEFMCMLLNKYSGTQTWVRFLMQDGNRDQGQIVVRWWEHKVSFAQAQWHPAKTSSWTSYIVHQLRWLMKPKSWVDSCSVFHFTTGTYIIGVSPSKQGSLAVLINSKMSSRLALRYAWQYLLNSIVYESTLLLEACIPKEMSHLNLKYKCTTLDETLRKNENRQESGCLDAFLRCKKRTK